MKLSSALLLSVALCSAHVFAQEEPPAPTPEQEAAAAQAAYESFLSSLGWQTQGSGEMKEWATIQIPEGYRYLEGADAAKLMEAWGNVPSQYEGLIAVDNLDWTVLFEFDPSGYVKDDEKDQLDADKLLSVLQQQQDASNEYRRSQGLEEMLLEGWAVEPRYNEQTNNLEWGLLLRVKGSPEQFVNYRTKLLGREGVMDVTLICDYQNLFNILPTYQDLLVGYDYKPGKSYAEYRQGDKIAQYGLTALITGGAIYGAAKLGLLGTLMAFGKKFLKLIIAGIVAVGFAIKKFFARAAGREVREEPNP